MADFRTTLESCQLRDLGYVGLEFTLCKMRSDGQFNKEQLDRAVTPLLLREYIMLLLLLLNRHKEPKKK